MSNTNIGKKYRWKISSIVGPIIMAAFGGGFSFFIVSLMVSSQLWKDTLSNPYTKFVPIITLVMMLFPALVGVFLLVIGIGQVLFGYLRVTASGIEYKKWPFRKVISSWSDVERISRSTNFDMYSENLLVRKEKIGKHIEVAGGTLGSPNYHVIPLREIRAWQKGILEDELRKYAPHLFETEANA